MGVTDDDDLKNLRFETVARQAPLADLLRVHDWEYLNDLKHRCQEAKKHRGKTWLDPPGHPRDTLVSPESYTVAVRGAGAVCLAVDRVVKGEVRNAFVPLRPPGHHAGPSGLVYSDDGCPTESQGFCLINHVAVGAAYARYNYRGTIERIAIVDFDVHNGNGTAAIVRNLVPHKHTRMISSETSVTMPSYKPWLDETDAENVFFASLHLSAEDFYPRLAVKECCRFGEPEFGLNHEGASDDPAYPNVLSIPMHKTQTVEESSRLFRSLVDSRLINRLRCLVLVLVLVLVVGG
mmetsp:Transcript_10121/g.23666  ORF Transcript_10121/g.23666 Transcript_10121/m.23666 type:complete len:292 (+) Transcript_10121:799-1674(+)